MPDDPQNANYVIYTLLGMMGGMGGMIALMGLSTRRLELSMAKRQFRNQYKTALGEAAESFSPPSVGDLGALVRLYRDQVKESWVDGNGGVREVEPLATEPLNVYYGGGDYQRSDVIAAIAKQASKYAADAYALSPNTLYVHRDTVLSAMFFRMIKIED